MSGWAPTRRILDVIAYPVNIFGIPLRAAVSILGLWGGLSMLLQDSFGTWVIPVTITVAVFAMGFVRVRFKKEPQVEARWIVKAYLWVRRLRHKLGSASGFPGVRLRA